MTTPENDPAAKKRRRERDDDDDRDDRRRPRDKSASDAKVAAGYFTSGEVPDAHELTKPKGRGLME